MGKIRGELEDLAFRYLDPDRIRRSEQPSRPRRKEGEEFLAEVEGVLRDKMKETGIPARVEGRVKRLYSI